MRYVFGCFALLLFVFMEAAGQNDSAAVLKLHKKADGFTDKGQNDSAIVYAQKALELSGKINYTKGIASSLSSIGIGHMHKGEYAEALNYFFKALQSYESLKDREGILVQYGNIGIVYDNQNDNKKAFEYYGKALKMAEENKDLKHASIQYCNMAILHIKTNSLAKAAHFFQKALEIDSLRSDAEGVARNLNNLGSVYHDQKLYTEAIGFFTRALPIAGKLENKSIFIGSLVNIGYTWMDKGEQKKAEGYILRAMEALNQTDDKNLKADVEKVISDFYSETGKSDEAFLHYKNHIAYRDSVYNQEETRKSMAAEMNYEFEKKQAAIKFSHDKEVYELEAGSQRARLLMWFFAVGIVLVIVLLFFAKRAYDNKKRIAEFMASESNRKEIMLQEIHHRINNNLQIISSLLTLQANSAQDEKLSGYLQQSQTRIQSLSVVHDLLYKSDATLKIKMDQYLHQVLDFHKEIASSQAAKTIIETNIAETSFATKLAVPIALIVNETVTNSLKYAFNGMDNGKISISLQPLPGEENKWKLLISDNGNGLPAEENFRKDSLGVRLVSIMTKQIKGTLAKSNSPGATFEIVFVVKD